MNSSFGMVSDLLSQNNMQYDEFIATHDKDALTGAPKVPGESEPEVDAEKATGVAFQIIDDLLNEAGEFMENPDYERVKERTGEYVQEL